MKFKSQIMKRRYLVQILIPILVAICSTGYSQKLIQQEWEAFYTHQDSIFNVSTDLDANGDVYVTGYVNDLTEGRNIVTLKYDVDGNLLWSNDYHWGSDDRGFRNLCDASGNVYTLGRISSGVTSSLILIKYDAAGNQLWDFSHTIGTTNEPSDMLINSDGNIVILADALVSGQHDVIMVEVNPSGGMVANYQFDSGSNDLPVNLDMVVGKIGACVIIDNGMTSSSRIIQLNNGLTIDWYKDLAHDPLYVVKSIKYDQNGDILALINKSQLYNQAVLYKHSSMGDSLWTKELDAGNTYEIGKCLFVDGQNNAITACVNEGGLKVSVHLVNENGGLQWNKYYYSSGLTFKNFSVISDNSRIVVAGSESNLTSSNMVVFSLDYDAIVRWQYRENGTGGNRNTLTDFDFNTNDHIVMTGQIRFGTLFQIAVFDLFETDAFDAADLSGIPSGKLAYFPYMNQAKDIQGNYITGLCYYGNHNSNGNYLFNKAFVNTQILNDGDTSTVDSIVRWDFTFTGNFNPQIPTPVNPTGYYANFYNSGIQREKVDGYKKLVYPNSYEGIDMEIGENAFGNTIFFIVQPGSDYHEIEWIISGAAASVNSDGSLSCSVAGHVQTYAKPIIYQLDGAGNPVEINYSTISYGYQLDMAQTVSFDFPLGIYDDTKTFIIEMTQTGTYQTKSSEDNFAWCSYLRLPVMSAWNTAKVSKIDTDENNNSYYAGEVAASSTFAFPTTAGVAFPSPIGQMDVTVMKLNNDIEIEWATYYGGAGQDAGKSISVAPLSLGPIIYVTGTSNSIDFPLLGLVGSYQQTTSGESFIAELNDDGTANWSTRFEARINDCEIIENKLYVVGTHGITTPPLMDDGVNYYSPNGIGYIGVFKPGGFFIHGSNFGSTAADPNGYCEITAIDWNGSQNYALTGTTTTYDFVVTNPPVLSPPNYNFQGYGGLFTDAFIANIKTTGTIDFAYYIASPPYTGGGATIPVGHDLFYYSDGDRGNDIKFAPDGQSIYLVGEVFSDNLHIEPSLNPNGYNQPTRFPAADPFSIQLRPAGFIFKTDLNGSVLWSTYYSSWEYIEQDFPIRLQEISFDPFGNFFISGQQTKSFLSEQIPEYNIPIPAVQPLGFYHFDTPTYTQFKNGSHQESFIIGFSQTDELRWATYLGGWDSDQVKAISVSPNQRLYFGGAAYTINLVDQSDPDFFGSTPAEEEIYSFPDWEYNTMLGSTDWFNGQGAGDQCEFAGFFDISGLNNSVVGIEQPESDQGLIVFPNPSNIGTIFISLASDVVQSATLYTIAGEKIEVINQIGLTFVNIEGLSRGTYILECTGTHGVYQTKFIIY
jgi:hypothetical protein